MITLERTKDYELIKKVFTHPSVWPNMSDDWSGSPEDWEPLKDDNILYVLAKNDGNALGIWMLYPHSHTVWEIHTGLLPGARGFKAKRAVKAMHSWVWGQLPRCARIITQVPLFNRPAHMFALMAGLKPFGMNPKSFLKGGKLHDVILLGLSRPEV